MQGVGFRDSGLGFRVSGFGFRVDVSLGFRLQSAGFKVSGFGFWSQDHGFALNVLGSGFRSGFRI